MSNLTDAAILAKINQYITSNGNNSITGAQLNEILGDLTDSKSNNSHGHTASDVGLGNVDNTSDLNKPLSTAVVNALMAKMAHATYDPNANGYVDKAGKLHVSTLTDTDSSSLGWSLSSFTHLYQELDGNVTELNIFNGEVDQERIVYLSKDADGYSFEIAPDHSDTTAYAQGNVVGVPSNGSALGRIYYKAKASVSTGAFNPGEWDLYIKLQDDVLITPSYSNKEVDMLIITPRKIDPTVSNSPIYYSITTIYNV